MRNAVLGLLALLACCSLSRPSCAEQTTPDRPVAALAKIHVTAAGEVNAPGSYEVPANTSVDDFLKVAGGLTEMATDTVYLSHIDTTGRSRRHSINLKDARETGPGSLGDGDTVLVLRASLFSISGEVNKPGTYRMDANMTVQQAIEKAGDLTAFGSYKTAVVERKGSDGKMQTIKAKPDDFVEPDDAIRVKIKLF